jgi:protein-tyrosine phosphatase
MRFSPLARVDSAKVRAAKLTPLHLPILDNTAPSEKMMKEFLDFANDPKHQPTYVHCEAGKGRTCCAVACYRMAIQGWTAAQAVADGKKFGLQLESQISWLTGKFYLDLEGGSLAPYPLRHE